MANWLRVWEKITAAALAAPVIAIAGTVAPIPVSNLDFLKNDPLASFDKTDTELLKQTTFAALNEAKDGEMRRWSNPDTKNSGEVTVVRTLSPAEPKCRELLIANHAGNRNSSRRSVFCYDAAKDRWAAKRPSG